MTITSHTGTHVDAPRHLWRHGASIDEYPASAFAGPGTVLSLGCAPASPISPEDLEQAGDVKANDIVLISTGWARLFRTRDYFNHPYLTPDAAEYLVSRRVRMVGVDTLSPEAPRGLRPNTFDFDVHRILLSQDILIIENLGGALSALARERILVVACPLVIEGADGGPASVVGHRWSDWMSEVFE